jgi:hypothetical protein
MLTRVLSALRAAAKEFEEFPKREKRRRDANLDYNIQIALTQLKASAGKETYAFVTAFLEKPDPNLAATFVDTIEKLELDYQIPFLMAATKTDPSIIRARPFQKWAFKHSSAISAGAKRATDYYPTKL